VSPPVARVRRTLGLALHAGVEATVPRWPGAVTAALQRRRIAAIIRHAYATVPFYREAMRSDGLTPADIVTADDLARLPLIDDEIVQADVDAFISEACPKEARTALLTSGSTSGVRRLIVWDRRALVAKTARAQRDRSVLTRLAGEHPLATALREFSGRLDDGSHGRVSILPLDAASTTQRTLLHQSALVPASVSHYSLISPTEGHAAAADLLRRTRPRIVFSFGSYVEGFFAFLEASGREVPLPRVWVYMGDSVSPKGRLLATTRGCPLFSVYASTEAGAIGFQCERLAGFHLNVDLCAARVTDAHGTTLPAGRTGEIVISNLVNRGMVLLNYRQRDRGVLAVERCACGRRLPLLARLDGRTSEIVELGDGRRLSELELENVFRRELRAVSECQLAQPEPGSLTWRLIVAPGSDREELRNAVLARGQATLGESTRLAVEFPAALARGPSGKLLRVTR
jgi:phenylacetate-CoA ligase